MVVYPNGKEAFFPRTACPEPVEPDLYVVASAIESNAGFVVAENGNPKLWVLGTTGGFSNASGDFEVFAFYSYSNQIVYPCGGNSPWDVVTGEIQVTIPLTATAGSPDLSHMHIYVIPPGFLNQFDCTTQATSTFSQTT